MESLFWLIPAFFMVAVVYSMAGFGGGSSYLALLALSGANYLLIPPVALICNLIVASSAFYFYFRAGHFSIKKILPFIITSIPFAYWGGTLQIGKETFLLLLGLSLLAASLRLFLTDAAAGNRYEPSRKTLWLVGSLLGMVLGFLSGLVGIGGGIFLSPLLMLLGWAHSKQAAACASFFILVNSLSGLLGHLTKSPPDTALLIPLSLAVLAGGQIGSRLGSHLLPKKAVQTVTAALILFVAARLLIAL